MTRLEMKEKKNYLSRNDGFLYIIRKCVCVCCGGGINIDYSWHQLKQKSHGRPIRY